MSMEELMKTMVQGCAMNLPPLGLGMQQQQQAPNAQGDFASMSTTGLPPLSRIWGLDTSHGQPPMALGAFDQLQEDRPRVSSARECSLPFANLS